MRRTLLAAALLLALAAPAGAATFRAGAVVEGPVLAGAGVAWLSEVGDARAQLASAAPGETPRFWLALPRSDNDVAALDGAADGFAFAAVSYLREDPRVQIPFVERAGVWRVRGAALETVFDARCVVGEVEVEGELLAYARAPCARDERPMVVAGERTFPAGGATVQVAGSYVAFPAPEGDGSVVVRDVAADREVLRTGPRLVPLDLQPDGRLLVGHGDGGAAWVSPAEPALHPVDLRGGRALRLDGDRVLVGRPDRLELVALSGERTTLAAATGHARLGPADVDAGRLALVRHTCGADEIRLEQLGGPPLRFGRRSLCPVRLSEPARVVVGDVGEPVARIAVRCRFGSLAPCGRAVVRDVAGRRLTAGTTFGEDVRERDRFLTAAGVRRIVRSGRLPVRVEMREDGGRRLLQRPTLTVLRATRTARARLRRCLRRTGGDAAACAYPF